MQTARHVLLGFLHGASELRASLSEVETELRRQGVVGFGVEPIDVVHAASRDKQVRFDPTNQEVTLLVS